jgi:hypothetical protein
MWYHATAQASRRERGDSEPGVMLCCCCCCSDRTLGDLSLDLCFLARSLGEAFARKSRALKGPTDKDKDVFHKPSTTLLHARGRHHHHKLSYGVIQVHPGTCACGANLAKTNSHGSTTGRQQSARGQPHHKSSYGVIQTHPGTCACGGRPSKLKTGRVQHVGPQPFVGQGVQGETWQWE